MFDAVPPAVLEVVATLDGAGHRSFLVGGCVRDMLRGKHPKDFDVATPARPEQVLPLFKKVIPTGIQHGTVTVVSKGLHVEVTTFRSEGEYLDGRRPSSVAFETDINADLGRRDFTINAMAWSPVSKTLVDPWGGQADLAAKIIRCVRDPLERFGEDGLRAMRAVRFATVLDFTIEPKTLEAIASTLPTFQKIAIERTREEFVKLLLSPHARKGLGLLERTGLFGVFLPEAIGADFDATVSVPAELDVRLAVLLAKSGNPAGAVERLKLPTRNAEHVVKLLKLKQPPPKSDRAVREWVRDLGATAELLEAQLQVSRAVGCDPSAVAEQARAALNDPLVPKQLALNGGEIMKALGVGPGPVVGEATRFLMDRVLGDPSLNNPQALLALLKAWKT